MTALSRELVKRWRRDRIAGLLENRPRVGPQTAHFDLANACNTRCVTCWHHSPHLLPAHRPSAAWKREVLPLDRFVRALDDLVMLGGLENIILSGMGDPTLNDELYAMVAYAAERGLHVTIITNGLRLDVARLMASVGVAGPTSSVETTVPRGPSPGAMNRASTDSSSTENLDNRDNVSHRPDPNARLDLLFSVCGVTAKTWQDFHAHPRPDGFETMLTRLSELRAFGFRPKHVEVICQANFHELPAMVEFAAAQAAKSVSFKLASLAHGTEAAALDPDQKARLRDELVPLALTRARALGVETDLSAFARQIHPESARTAPIEDIGCFMGFLYARVSVLGEVLFCCNTAVPVGHLNEAPLGELWQAPLWQERREAVRAGRYFSGCDQCGKLKQNLKWSERLRRDLPPSTFAALLGREAPVETQPDASTVHSEAP